MAKRIYVGTLPAGVTERELSTALGSCGTVRSVTIDARKGTATVELDPRPGRPLPTRLSLRGGTATISTR